jgi:hypothetical protein
MQFHIWLLLAAAVAVKLQLQQPQLRVVAVRGVS